MGNCRNLFFVGTLALLTAINPCSADVVRNVKSPRIDANGNPIVNKPPVGKRITAEELAEKRKKIDDNRQYVRVNNETIDKGRSIYDGSVILAANGKHTVLPEGTLAYVPEFHSAKVVDQPVGEFILWPDFYKANAAWIRTLDVTLDQVKGTEPISEQRIKAMRGAGVVVVTLYEGHPTSFRGKFEVPDKEN